MPVAPLESASAGRGLYFLMSAEVVYAIIAAACSSPQTTELNADKRAGTLMKWVHIGLVQSAGFLIIASAIDREHAFPILLGGSLAAGIMYGSYAHAKAAGLASGGEGTEDYGDGVPWMKRSAA